MRGLKTKAVWVTFVFAFVIDSAVFRDVAFGQSLEPEIHSLVGPKSGIKKDEPAEDAKWEPDWIKLCSYDDFCHRLKNDSVWLNPTRPDMEILKRYREDIKKAAQTYGVDARAIVGSLLADLVIIPHSEARIREELVDPSSKRPFPLGLVYPVAGVPVEPLAAKIEKRPVRDDKEVVKILGTQEGTIWYAAAVIRDAQDRYKNHGVDISGQPDILTTLYNLGKVEPKAVALEERIKKAKELEEEGKTPEEIAAAGYPPERLKPRINFFGLFVNKNLKAIEGILDPNDKFSPAYFTPPDPSVCQAERNAALGEFAGVTALSKELETTYTQKMQSIVPRITHLLLPDPAVQNALKTLKTLRLSQDDEFDDTEELKEANKVLLLKKMKEEQQAFGAIVKEFRDKAVHPTLNSLCQGLSRREVARGGNSFYCTRSYDPPKEGLAEQTFSVRLLRGVVPTVKVCAVYVLRLRPSVSNNLSLCSEQDLEKNSKIETKLYGENEIERKSFYGSLSSAIPASPEKYISLVMPIECLLPHSQEKSQSDRKSSVPAPSEPSETQPVHPAPATQGL